MKGIDLEKCIQTQTQYLQMTSATSVSPKIIYDTRIHTKTWGMKREVIILMSLFLIIPKTFH